MPVFQSFVGGTYTELSPVFAADTAVNVYVETRTVEGSAKRSALYGTPGLLSEGSVATLGTRGMFTQDGRTFFVTGAVLYERLAANNYAVIGNVGNDGLMVSFASNGRGGEQLGIVSAGSLYVLALDTGTFTTVVLPFSNPVMITFLDGYGLINEADSPTTWFSNLEDLLIWDALDFFARSGTSDNVVAIAVSRDRVWCIGSKTTTLFYNSGDVDTPFVPYPGTAMQVGITTPQVLGIYADQLLWVAESARGQRRVVMAVDAQPQPVSTAPIDAFLASSPTLDDAELLVYEQDAHIFWCITLPSSTQTFKTYSFDITEGLWHARSGWDSTLGIYLRWRARGSTSVDGQILVGDYATGNLYELSQTTYSDNGAIIRRERTTPYLSESNQAYFVSQFQLGAQAGVGLEVGQGSNPLVTLEISRNGAQTFTNVGNRSVGATGAYLNRCVWHRLGRFIGNLAVFRVTMTDPVKCVWQTAFVEIEEGTGQL